MIQTFIGVTALSYAAGKDLKKDGKNSTTANVAKTIGRVAAPVPTLVAEQAAKHPNETKKIANAVAWAAAPLSTAIIKEVAKDPKKAAKTAARTCAPLSSVMIEDVAKNGKNSTTAKVAKAFCPVLNLFF